MKTDEAAVRVALAVRGGGDEDHSTLFDGMCCDGDKENSYLAPASMFTLFTFRHIFERRLVARVYVSVSVYTFTPWTLLSVEFRRVHSRFIDAGYSAFRLPILGWEWEWDTFLAINSASDRVSMA